MRSGVLSDMHEAQKGAKSSAFRRALLGDLARPAARIVTDGGFQPDDIFVPPLRP